MKTYRAAPSAYAVFGAITGALAMLWLVAMWRTGAPWLPLLAPVAGFAVVALWLARFRLTFCEDEVRFASPFRRERRIVLGDVLSVEVAERTGPTESPFTLCIRLITGEELRLNAKVFPPEAARRLLALRPSATPARDSR